MKVLCIISRDLEKGSTQYRLVQYADFLRDCGIALEFVHRDELSGPRLQEMRDFDVVLNQKCLLPLSLSKKILKLGRRTIFDFDDAIYTRPGRPYSLLTGFRVKKRFRFWLEHADLVTTANRYLADRARPYASSLSVVPMAVDTETWKPVGRSKGDGVRIGWAGSPATLHHIERIGPVLASLLQRNRSLSLAIFSGKKPDLPCPFEFHPYGQGAEPAFVQGLDIGLLPLADEEYSRGKSPIKAIQYLACGVPVVGNILGASSEILGQDRSIGVTSDEEWLKAVETLVHAPDLRIAMGGAGRKFIMEHHDRTETAEQLCRLLTDGSHAGAGASGEARKPVACTPVSHGQYL